MTAVVIERDQRVVPALGDFSVLAGPIEEPPEGGYRVRYRAMRGDRRLRLLLLVALNVGFEAFFIGWLLHPVHRTAAPESGFALVAHWFLLCSIGLMELLRMVNVVSLSVASVVARDPVPVRPDPTLRVAFLTTVVPGKEPISMVRATLLAATRIRHGGLLDVWILDEGDDDEVKAVARELGVRHFSRKGIARYNQAKGPFRAKTKHGNYNAWVDAHGGEYDIFLSVDTDHVPLPNYAERILGYFRDPDVAYVVGPQCYRNVGTYVTRGAESQQFPFHSVIQRAANRYGAAMLVGTNNAIRISALRSAGGLADSITEDMATGLQLHAAHNPQTGRRWKSVYTPDVLAAGEGPSSWGDYFSQQMRWSRGTFEVLLTTFWRQFPRLSPGQMLHYGMITTFYPSMAFGWILGAVNAMLTLALGQQAIVVPPSLWIALYVDVTAFQLWLYFSNRRYNVSPYESENSTGLQGILMSVVAAPMYASQLVATLLRRPARFVVTPKGASASQDSLLVFRRHLMWFGLVAGALVVALVRGHATALAATWVAVTLLVCLFPIIQWRCDAWSARLPAQHGGGEVPSLEHPLSDSPLRNAPAPPAEVRRRPSRRLTVARLGWVASVLHHRAVQARTTLSPFIRHTTSAVGDAAQQAWGTLGTLVRRALAPTAPAHPLSTGKESGQPRGAQDTPTPSRATVGNSALRRGARRGERSPHVHVRRGTGS